MKEPGIIRDIALRSAGYTLAAGWVLGVAYSVLLFLVALALGFMNDFSDTSFLGRSGLPPISNRYDLSNLDALGAAGTIPAILAAVFVGIVIGGFAGSIVGGIAGAVAGVFTGALTSAAFYPITYGNLHRFQTTIAIVGVAVTPLVAFMLGPQAFRMLTSGRAGSDSPAAWLIQALVPALLAGVAAWWASRHVGEWYEDEYLDSSAVAG